MGKRAKHPGAPLIKVEAEQFRALLLDQLALARLGHHRTLTVGFFSSFKKIRTIVF
jgi:hypothetical protein